MLVDINKDNQRARVLIEAIKANNGIDADRLAASLQKPRKTPREILNGRLLRGCVFTLLGVAAAIYVNFAPMNDPHLFIHNICYLVTAACLAIGIGFLITYFVTRKQAEPSGHDEPAKQA